MKQAIILETVSAAASNTSVIYGLGDLKDYAIQTVFSGGAGNLAGTLTLECSNDEFYPPTNFVTIQGTSQAVTNSTNHTWNVSGASYPYVRARWVFTSGTGNMKQTLTVKENLIKGA